MLTVVAESVEYRAQAELIAARLQLPLIEENEIIADPDALLVWVGRMGVGLKPGGANSPNPVYVDFVNGAIAHRQHSGSLHKEMIAKAVGVKSNRRPSVLDATAGFGRDAYLLAALGCQVTLLDRNPVMVLMLEEGLQRAVLVPACAEIVGRMSVQQAEAQIYLNQLQPQACPEVVYLDPMFPHRRKSAKVKKDMQILQRLLGLQQDSEELLGAALEKAKSRVVVKRPRHAPVLAGMKPSHSINGKSSRFDVYLSNP